MAAFEVPIATGLFTGIPRDIATAPGAATIGNAIGNLPDAYWSGQSQAYQQRLRDLFKNGVPGNLGDIATQLAQAKGAEAIPEFIALRQRQALDEIAARQPPPSGVVDTGAPSGYLPPGSQTRAEPQQDETPPAPTAGTATARQIATARASEGVTLDNLMKANPDITDPDAPLTAPQRAAAIDNLRAGRAPAPVPTPAGGASFAGRFPQTAAVGTPFSPNVGTRPLPPPVGSPSPPAPAQPRPAQAQPQAPAQVAQAPTQAQASPIQAPADPQAVWIERTAAANAQRAAWFRRQQEDFSHNGDAVSAKAAGETAGVYEARANDAYKALLERSKPPTASIEARDPAIRQRAGDTESDKADITAFNADYNGIQKLSRSAGSQGLARIEELQKLTSSPDFYSGPLSKQMQTYQQFKAAFGQNANAAVPMEVFKKGTNDLLTEAIRGLAGAGVGRVLQSEVRNMRDGLATLEISPAGNRAQLETLRRTYLQQQAIGGIADQVARAVASHQIPQGQYRIALNNAIEAYTEKNKPFTAEEQANPILLGAVNAPPNIQHQPLAQVRAWEAQNSVTRGDAIRMPNGTYIKAP